MGYDEEDTFLLPLNVTISLSPVGVENIGIDEFAGRKGHIKLSAWIQIMAGCHLSEKDLKYNSF
ncbi:MAG: hypothetical protein PUK16_00160 [Prevotellaceae bacterium]|nr:hypothetical protein [Prevotella sp.]MDD7529366.1 hypothetical protein [Prevotellaceae bacterium]MDY2634376.1 hypothetical protein [Prevotella sp.]